MISIKHARPHVVVVGLKGNQKRVVAEKCGGLAQLVFVPSSRASTRYSSNADFVILSKFVPHRFSVAARRLDSHYCRGGLDAICRAIRAFVASWTRR